MTELPTPPFPELHALDHNRPVPSIADLLQGSPSLPTPRNSVEQNPEPEPPILGLPRFPAAPQSSLPPQRPPESRHPKATHLDDPPVIEHRETLAETLAALLAEDGEQPSASPASYGAAPPPVPDPRDPAAPDQDLAPTDKDLADALQPAIQSSMNSVLFGPETGLQGFLEPMLRNTVRRAIAEQMETSRLFRRIGTFDRLAWRLRALVTSRSYEDIIFDRTRRYQVEEAYLLRRNSKSLLSYASHDPARHANSRRVQSTIRLLAGKIQAPDGSFESSFDLPDFRTGLVREGNYCLLVAVLRGRSNALVRADLDYILHQAEDRFGERLETRTDAFIRVLQPILEGCLLIQSPAPPH